MSRYGDLVRAYKEPEPVYGDTDPKDILLRYVRCFISHIECPDGHWCFVFRDARTGQERESAEPRPYNREGSLCLRLKTGAAPVEGEPFGVFDCQMEVRPGEDAEDGEVVILTETGIEFSVWKGDVRFGPEIEMLSNDFVRMLFEERYDAEYAAEEAAAAEGDRVSAVTAI